jgi:hypothetical protein
VPADKLEAVEAVPPEGDQEKVYPGVPPEGKIVAEPVDPPKQAILVCAAVDVLIAVGCVIVKDLDIEFDALSVIVQV